MYAMRGFFDRILGVSLRIKLIGGFVVVIGLTVIAAAVSILSQHHVQSSINKVFDVDDEIAGLSLKSVTSIYKARRNEKDFLLQYRKVGFKEAKARYITLLQVQISDICNNMATIRQLTSDPDLNQQTMAVQDAVHRYESGFLSVVDLFGRLGHVEDGLESQFRMKIHEIEAIVKEHQLNGLLIDMLALRRAEKDYLLRGIEKYAWSVRKLVGQFKADVVRAGLPALLEATLLALIRDYAALFEEYVQTSSQIASGTDTYRAAGHLVEPLLENLYAQTRETVSATRRSLDHVALTTMRVIGGVGLGVILLGLAVAFVISGNITRGVRACIDFAGRVAQGDLATCMICSGRDEFAMLAVSLNQMAEALSDSRLSQERRSQELAAINQALENEIATRSRLATAIEQAAESIFITDRKGSIMYANPAFELVSGYARQELYGLNFRIFKNSQHDEGFYRTMWNTISRGELWTGHITNTLKDGTVREFETTISPIRNGGGSIVNFVSVNRDVTQEVKLERQLRQAQKMEAIGTLAGGIAHDFNNILGIIFGYTDMALLDAPDGTQSQHHLREIQKAGYRAKDLVRQILAFSRQGEQERKPLQIGTVIKEGLKLLRAALPSTIEIRQNIGSLPYQADVVMADLTQIHQVLMNLCTNAGHAMHEKGGTLEVGLATVEFDPENVPRPADLNPGSYVRMSVSDTGHGMDQAVLDRIFEPYFTTKAPGEGTGLGLAVVHGIVKSHGGAITVYSNRGEGTVFHVYLPRLSDETPLEATAVQPLLRGTETVLFVDDEPGLVDSGKKLLEYLGYKVVPRTNSFEALQAFRAQPDKFDLVITDLTMPQMTGLELTRELLHIRPEIPIILCTGFSTPAIPEKAKALGIRGLVMKPLIISEIAAAIRKVLDATRQGEVISVALR